MQADPPPVSHQLLSLCSLLLWFDEHLLRGLAPDADGDIAAILASDLVSQVEGRAAFSLHERARAETLAWLRAERPHDELELRTQIFTHFLRQLEQAGDAGHPSAEDDCLHHLDELFGLFAARREWQTISRYAGAVRAARPLQAHHLHQLQFYDGFVAIRAQDYDQGERILQGLLVYPDLADSLRVKVVNALGLAYWFQSLYDRAIAAYEQVHALAGALGNLPYQGYALLNIGMVHSELRHYERALELSAQSREVFRRLGDTMREAQALHEIGNNAMQLGRWAEAQGHFQQAIQIYQAFGMEGHLANLYACQGFLQHMLGDEAQSEEAYARALAIAESPDHTDTALAMDNLLYLGFLYQTLSRWSEALLMYERAAQLARQVRNQHVLSLIHYRCGDVLRHQGRPDDAFLAYQRAIATIETLRSATEAEEVKVELLGSVQQVYEAMVLHCLECGRPEDAYNYVERARSRAFLDQLVKKAPELYEAVNQPVATLAEVQAQLPEGALLVEYFTTGVLPYGEHLLGQIPKENARLREHLTIPPRIVIFAVTREDFVVRDAELDPNKLRLLPNDPLPGQLFVRPRMLVSLYTHLVEPVAPMVGRCDMLYIVPHGPLHYVPFMALRAADDTNLLDADGPPIALAPSATILLRNCLSRPLGRGAGMLALGYNGEGGDALRYAEAEASAVAHLMRGQAWVGPAAKASRLIAEGGSARWLHVAGHAYYNAQDPLASRLHLGEGDALSARAIISDLDLRADLVMLSACTTGLSHVVPGDELFGLQRAFLYAGAPAVVCTLWDAEDLVALLVMERFYQALRRGERPATALHGALVAIRSMTGRDLAATTERWVAEYPEHAHTLAEVREHALEQSDVALYREPLHWATFILVGRGA